MANFEVALRGHDSDVSTWSISVPTIFTIVIAFALISIILRYQLPHNKEAEVDHSEHEEAFNTDSGGDEGMEDAKSDADSDAAVVDFETEAIRDFSGLNDFENEAARLRGTWSTT
ncbi:hypothetical protein LTR70_001313 [Exophiala xenobiotica]|uniref:Uncharacterized protein n=1 Tax=Lithohypha guttulata TaxID=1690604 RepID=A0ABR0KMH1_9EURO|nr:hypothetical protein LTR24_000931 [Lithohypha guttulata]KAK5327992.1 hypothetical protein LTR70_001313 [Exophiala xenobiotica]